MLIKGAELAAAGDRSPPPPAHTHSLAASPGEGAGGETRFHRNSKVLFQAGLVITRPGDRVKIMMRLFRVGRKSNAGISS